MKRLIYIFSVFVLMLSGCEFDNYDPPQSMLTGSLVYEGTPVGIRQGINVIQLYEPGWENFTPINVNVKQDGTFSANLFEGNYKLIRIAGNGPWIDNTDTIDVQLRGAQTVIDVPVDPFFVIRNEDFQLNGSTLTASFTIDQIVEGSNLQTVTLYIGKTILLDNLFNMGSSEINGSAISNLDEQITISRELNDVSQGFVFARVGVKAAGSAELIFSQVQKIQIN